MLHASMYVHADAEEIEAALQGLIEQNRVILRRASDEGRPLPALYDSGLVWHREAPGHEDWLDYRTLLRRKLPSDCEDLASARVAELREDGEEDADVYVYLSRGHTYHVIVRRGDGRFEDPSRITLRLAKRRRGVGSVGSLPTRSRKMSKRLRWGLRRVPGGWQGRIQLGLDDNTVRNAVAIAVDKRQALHDAAAIAQRLANNPAVQALLPPGTLPILKGVRVLAKYGMSPQGKAVLRNIASGAPKAMKHLLHHLHF